MSRLKICGIYKITSPSGRVYIGESVDILTRWLSYKSVSCKNQFKLLNSLKKYTPENHIFEIIEECEREELKCRERYWQDFYDVLNGGLNCKLTQLGICDYCGEETLIFKTQKDANSAYKKLEKEQKRVYAWWYSKKQFEKEVEESKGFYQPSKIFWL